MLPGNGCAIAPSLPTGPFCIADFLTEVRRTQLDPSVSKWLASAPSWKSTKRGGELWELTAVAYKNNAIAVFRRTLVNLERKHLHLAAAGLAYYFLMSLF